MPDDNPNEDAFHRGIRRVIINHRGERVRVPPIADAATADASHDPYLDLDTIGADLDGIVGPYGVPIANPATPDPDAEPPPDNDPDANRDDEPDGDDPDQSRDDHRRNADWDGWCNAFADDPHGSRGKPDHGQSPAR